MRRRTYISIFFVLIIIAGLIAIGYRFGKDIFSSKKTGWINNGNEYNIDLKFIPDGSGREAEKIVYEYYLPNDSSTGKILAQLKSVSESDNIEISFIYNKDDLGDELKGEEYKDLILEPNEQRYVYLVIKVIDPNKEAYYKHKIEWVLRTKVNVTFDLGCGNTIVKEVLLGASLDASEVPLPPTNILGCLINGWYADPEGLQEADLTQGFINDATIYAKCVYKATDWLEYDTTSKCYYVTRGEDALPSSDLEIPATYDDGVHGVADVRYIEASSELTDDGTSEETDSSDSIGVFVGKNLTSVKLPESIIKIGAYAFNMNTSLTEITLPESLKTIEKCAFRYTGIKSLHIPKNVRSISNIAFRYCSALENITIAPENSVYDSRDNCNALIITKTNVLMLGAINSIIPNSVVEIGTYAFYSIPIQSVTFPESVKKINTSAFARCNKLTSVELPSSLDIVKQNAFRNCSELTSAIIGAKELEGLVFSLCEKLTNATIKEGVQKLGENIFSSTEVSTIIIPSTVTYIAGSLRQGGAESLTTIKVSKSNTVYTSRDPSGAECNVILKIDNKELIMGCNYSTIPSGTKIIRSKAFSGKYNLTSVVIPKSVVLIEKQTFRYTTSMASIIVQSGNPIYTSRDSSGNECNVIIEIASATLLAGCRNSTIPNGVKHIGEYAFYCQRGFPSKALSLPSTLETIGSHAFWDAGIKNIVIPANVTQIGCHSFSYDSKGSNTFESITFEDASTWYVTTSSSYTGGAMLTEDALNNGAKNATLFGDTYNSYYWYKK